MSHLTQFLGIVVSIAFSFTSFATERNWNQWYAVKSLTLKKTIIVYHEKVETNLSDIHVQLRLYRLNSSPVVEEFTGSIAQLNSNLEPRSFSFVQKTNNQIHVQVDGSSLNKKEMRISVKNGKRKPFRFDIPIEQNTLLATQFPVFLSLHRQELQSGKKIDFNILVEDDLRGEFHVRPGSAKKGKEPNSFLVYFGEQSSVWTISSTSAPSKITLESQQLEITPISKQQAERYLSKNE